jgi:hypothetical protein
MERIRELYSGREAATRASARQCSADALVLANLVREFGGSADLLWTRRTTRLGTVGFRTEPPLVQSCFTDLPEETMIAFVRSLLSEHPGLLCKHGGDGLTLLSMAIREATLAVIKLVACKEVTPVTWMGLTPLHSASINPRYPVIEFLVNLNRDALNMKDWSGRLPIHLACSGLMWLSAGDDIMARVDSIQRLVDENPASLDARNNSGDSPVMIIMKQAPRGVVLLPPVLQLLRGMVERAPGAVLGLYNREPAPLPIVSEPQGPPPASTVLEKVCTFQDGLALAELVTEAWPAALCFSFTEGMPDDIPEETARAFAVEAHFMVLALTEVLLHDTTRGVVPDPIRERVLRAVSQIVRPCETNGSSLSLVQAIQNRVRGQDRQEFRSAVLNHDALQNFLQGEGDILEMVTSLYRMNRAGRIRDLEEAGAVSGTSSSAGRHVRILSAAGKDLSCLFLHLRDCCDSLVAGGDDATAPSNSDGCNAFERQRS